MPWLVLAYIASICQSSVLTHDNKMKLTKFEISVLLKHYWKQEYRAAAATRRICEVEGESFVVSVWHNDGSNVSTLEKKTVKIYHVLEDIIMGY